MISKTPKWLKSIFIAFIAYHLFIFFFMTEDYKISDSDQIEINISRTQNFGLHQGAGSQFEFEIENTKTNSEFELDFFSDRSFFRFYIDTLKKEKILIIRDDYSRELYFNYNTLELMNELHDWDDSDYPDGNYHIKHCNPPFDSISTRFHKEYFRGHCQDPPIK